jgi:hypothetical protein
MAVWPSIQEPSYPFNESIQKRQIKNNFESGHVLSRAASTVSKRIFELRWRAMPDADYTTLETFFKDNIGLTFTWTHPTTLEVITVRFSEDKMDTSIPFLDHRTVKLVLEEAP